MARRIRYKHPHWPGRTLLGTILSTGVDGHRVRDDDTGQERVCRHEDVVEHLPEREDRDEDRDTGDFDSGGDGFGKSHALYGAMDSPQLGALAAPYLDQYAVGHPADYRLEAPGMYWRFEPHFPLDRLPGGKGDWQGFNFRQGRHLGFAKTQEPPVIVVRGRDDHHYLLDGNHRVAESHAADLTHIPAIVGGPLLNIARDPTLPPGGYGRAGLRKSLGLGPLLLLKSTVRMGTPGKLQAAKQKVHQRLGGKKGAAGGGLGGVEAGVPVAARARQWDIPAPVAHQPGHVVQYQRPDMGQPEIGRIEALGRHGGWVSDHQGRWRKVRHEHIHGQAFAHVAPEERAEAAESLLRAGVPVDEIETMLEHGAQDGPNAALMERVKALLDDGAPIRKEGLKGRSEAAVHRLVEKFTGPIPREEWPPKEPPQPGKRRPNPYNDEEH